MIKYLEEKHGLNIRPKVDELCYLITIPWLRKIIAIEHEFVHYQDITHSELDWYTESICDCCDDMHKCPKYKEVVDVPAEFLTEEQKEEQRQVAESAIKKLKNA